MRASIFVAAAMFVAAPAYADVTYDFEATSVTEILNGVSSPWGAQIHESLVFSDAAVAAGFTSGQFFGPPPGGYSDPGSGLVGGRIGIDPQTICPTPNYPTCFVEGSFTLAFNADGTLSGGIPSPGLSSGGGIGWGQISGEGTGSNWTITLSQDDLPSYLIATGSWQAQDPPSDPVPEPASAALLASGVALLALMRRHRIFPRQWPSRSAC